IGETVADHPAPRRQRRTDGALQMIAAGGEHQQGLGHRRPAARIAVQGDVANVLGAVGSPGFASLQDLEVSRAQPLDQPRDLSRLAGPLAAFEGDESALGHRRTMAAPARFATLYGADINKASAYPREMTARREVS